MSEHTMSIEEQMMKIRASSYPTRFLSRKGIPDLVYARKVSWSGPQDILVIYIRIFTPDRTAIPT